MSRELWETLHERFDPAKPPAQASWRVDRPYSPVEGILKKLARPFEDERKRFLIYGTTGAGKTTEVLRIADARTDDSFVVVIDVQRHFDAIGDSAAIEHLQPWEVVFLCGLALVRAARERFGHSWAADALKPLNDAATQLLGETGGPTVDVAKLAGSVLVLAGGAMGGPAGSGAMQVLGDAAKSTADVVKAGKWTVRLGRRERAELVGDQDTRARNLLAAVNGLLGTLQQSYRPVTFIVDGLDRIQDAETTERLFIDSGLLGSLVCPTVVTAPSSLVTLGATRTRFDTSMLYSIPVMKPEHLGDPAHPAECVSCFVDAFAARTTDVEGAARRVPEAIVRRIAYYSGGRFRDFVRFVRDLAGECWDDDVDVATNDHLDRVLDQWRKLYEEGLDADGIALLMEAAQTRQLPGGDDVLPLIIRLQLLPFPNGTKWWAPHPLLFLGQVLR